ncbi:M48 family metalloprotease [Paraurantiacibacter namhicola]|uniref:TPR repeat-containing protein YfgC n=1 Tax=Paraurantiacibacter namhicola TaxID=645517 RepID=A0A1C7D668_9SPHN|nr:M48 family metalloprotease [Paraurantiacibacter namhicola]ANU06821.1 TPR repeat-containing protein YfgC precursor [Paraurantiacibacter namhicola]
MTRIFARFLAVIAAFGMVAQPAAAQSILRDAETEQLLQDMMDPLAEAAGLGAGSVEVVLINDGSINAFVAGGQRVYIHSGLIGAADTANEVQGVLAHELGHITGGHILRFEEGIGNATKITLLSLLVGIGAALAGSSDAAVGAMALGQQAAQRSFLSFSRAQESSADAAGAEYLSKAGISGRGSLAFFGKLQNYEFRRGYSQSDEAGFARTHPLSGDRIANLRADYEADPAWDTPSDPVLERRFTQAKAKLFGYLSPPERTLQFYPENDQTVPARYARAYAYHKDARLDMALAETDALLLDDPDNAYFLELRGQVLLESGKPLDALPNLREATRISGHHPLIASTFAHALIATEDEAYLPEAEQVLRAAVGRDRENPFAWYQLGIVYGRQGDMPRARLASAEFAILTGKPTEALSHAEYAEANLPYGTPDWIRAQDVALQARDQLERMRERR